MTADTKHIVAYPLHAWGHTRPMIVLCARLVTLRPNVQVTILTANSLFDRVEKELARNFDPDSQDHARVSIIALGNFRDLNVTLDDTRFEDVWTALINGEGVVCGFTGRRCLPLPKPRAIILDVLGTQEAAAVKGLSGDAVKMYSWWSGNIHRKAEEEACLSGRPYKDIAIEMNFQVTGKLIQLPGIPPMFDYEVYPQDFPNPEDLAVRVFSHVFETTEKLDGVIMASSEAYEPDATAAIRAWFGKTERQAYAVGPLLPFASKVVAVENEKRQSNESMEIQTLLDKTLERKGEKSLLYISFGSFFWPVKTPEKLWAFLDVVMELDIPFILSHACPLAVVPDDVKEKVKVYRKGVMSAWTPQQLILNHPATGWFVAHGGHNGLTEAIASGVPMILWPFAADQPFNAIMVTDKHKIGYELFQVRSGHGLKKIYHTGSTPTGTVEAVKLEARNVLTREFGKEGDAKREELLALRERLLGEWAEDGASRKDVEAFLDCL